MLSDEGNLDLALDSHSTSRAIHERLAAADPGNGQWQPDLIVSHVKLAEMAQRDRLTAAEAQQHDQAALAIARDLHARDRLAPRDAWMVADLEIRLARLTPPSTELTRTPAGSSSGATSDPQARSRMASLILMLSSLILTLNEGRLGRRDPRPALAPPLSGLRPLFRGRGFPP